MYSDWEKNVIFIGSLVLLLVVFIGTAMVDSSLNRLIMPEIPFATAAIRYDHGITWEGPESQLCLKALKVADMSVGECTISIDIGIIQAEIPFVLTLWESRLN